MAYFANVNRRREDLKEELTGTSTYENVRYNQGYIQALADILDISFEDEEQ